MEKKFYDFCKENGFTGSIWITPQFNEITFNVKKRNYGFSQTLKMTDITALEFEERFEFTLKHFKNKMEEKIGD